MTTTSTETTTGNPAFEREEPAEAELRNQLNLRPIYYPANGDGWHADRRPCPSWCWVGLSAGKYDHEVATDTPMVAATRWTPPRTSWRACIRLTWLQ